MSIQGSTRVRVRLCHHSPKTKWRLYRRTSRIRSDRNACDFATAAVVWFCHLTFSLLLCVCKDHEDADRCRSVSRCDSTASGFAVWAGYCSASPRPTRPDASVLPLAGNVAYRDTSRICDWLSWLKARFHEATIVVCTLLLVLLSVK